MAARKISVEIKTAPNGLGGISGSVMLRDSIETVCAQFSIFSSLTGRKPRPRFYGFRMYSWGRSASRKLSARQSRAIIHKFFDGRLTSMEVW